jgi:phage FluMu protein Com
MTRERTEHRAVKYLQTLKKPRGKAFYRCGSCKRPYVLKRELWLYIRYPKCPMCGEVNWIINNHAHSAWKNKTGSYAVCHCHFVFHPHKPKSVPECEANFL